MSSSSCSIFLKEYIITKRCMHFRHSHDDQGCALTCMRMAGAGYHGKLTGPLLVTPQMPCWDLQSFKLPRGQRWYGFERRPRSYGHLPRPRSRRIYGLLLGRRLRLLRQRRRLLPRRLFPRCLSRQATRTIKQSSFPAQVPAGFCNWNVVAKSSTAGQRVNPVVTCCEVALTQPK